MWKGKLHYRYKGFLPLPRLEVSFLRGIEVTRLSRRLRAREEVNGSWKFFPFSGGGRIVETYRIRRFVDTVKCLSADFYRDCVRLDSIENFRQFRPRNTAVPAPPPRTTTPFFPSLFNVLPPRWGSLQDSGRGETWRIGPQLRNTVYRSTMKSWTRSKLGGIPSITAPSAPVFRNSHLETVVYETTTFRDSPNRYSLEFVSIPDARLRGRRPYIHTRAYKYRVYVCINTHRHGFPRLWTRLPRRLVLVVFPSTRYSQIYGNSVN